VVFADVDVDSVVAVGAADVRNEWQVKNLWMLAKPPDVGLVSCKASTVDSALLACSSMINCYTLL
jgi:hypothetical protein